jgi:phosphate butyryltransferase
MVPVPDLDQKVRILENAVQFFHTLGYDCPQVAVLAANEKFSEKIPGSADALALKEMNENGVITGCLVDGPISLDLALVPEAVRIKRYEGSVRGDADILLVHDVSAGNYLAKALILLAGWSGGGLVIGAKVPVILLSRGDSAREKYQSMILGLLGCSREGAGE